MEAQIETTVPLSRYASVRAALAEEHPLAEALAAESLDENAWSAADLAWKVRLAGGDGALLDAYRLSLACAEDRMVRRISPIDRDPVAWASFCAAFSRVDDAGAFLGRIGLGQNDLSRLVRTWQRKLEREPALQRQLAEAQRAAAPLPKIDPAPRPPLRATGTAPSDRPAGTAPSDHAAVNAPSNRPAGTAPSDRPAGTAPSDRPAGHADQHRAAESRLDPLSPAPSTPPVPAPSPSPAAPLVPSFLRADVPPPPILPSFLRTAEAAPQPATSPLPVSAPAPLPAPATSPLPASATSPLPASAPAPLPVSAPARVNSKNRFGAGTVACSSAPAGEVLPFRPPQPPAAPPPNARAGRRGATLATESAAVARAILPFAGASLSPPPPRPPSNPPLSSPAAGALARTPFSDEPHTLEPQPGLKPALPFAGARPSPPPPRPPSHPPSPNPVQTPSFSPTQYASLVVEWSLWPERRADTLHRYGVTEAQKRAIDDAWHERFTRGSERDRFTEACVTYRAWLLAKSATSPGAPGDPGSAATSPPRTAR